MVLGLQKVGELFVVNISRVANCWHTLSQKKKYVFVGVLLGGAFVHPVFWWTAFLGVALLVQLVRDAKCVKDVLRGTLLVGCVQFLIVLFWFWSTHPIEGFRMTWELSFVAVFVSWVLSAVSIGVGKLLVTIPLFLLRSKSWVLYIVPVFWVLSDMAGAFLHTVLTYGPGTTWNTNFSFGWLGYLMAIHPLFLPLAGVGGVFVLTFAYVFITVFLVDNIKTKSMVLRGLMCGVMLIVVMGGVWPVPDREFDIDHKIAMIETTTGSLRGVSGEDADAYFNDLFEKILDAIRDDAEYIILPEGASMTKVFGNPQDTLLYLANASNGNVVLVDSAWHYVDDESSYVRARIYDTRSMQIYELDKQYLVPQGEFMPYIFIHIMNTFGFDEGVAYYSNIFNYVPGKKTDSAAYPSYLPGVMFCFESVSPFGVRKAASYRDVPFVAHPVSHAWFNEPDMLWHQLDLMLKVNARFGGVPVFQASNNYKSMQY